ncbi:MAG: MerR family transcriptional regulator [Saprospiraceae bacterium]|nr:MerR family transcriptional regulator [Saprospiraceae bacterium]
MAVYSIKDLEKLSGIKAHTIRIWEQRYGIISPERTQTNIRYYEDEDLKRLLNIALLNKNGIKISKIAQMSHREVAEKVAAISEINFEYDTQLDALTISMIEMDELKFDRIVSTNIAQMGFEGTMLEIIYPFLEKLNLLWLTGSINPAQENFMSYLIRQKIIVAIDKEPFTNIKNAKKFLLYLPEGEKQELTMLFMHYLIKSRRHQVIYIGQEMTIADLKEAYDIHRPTHIFTMITETFAKEPVQRYADKLSKTFPDSNVLLSGYQVVAQNIYSFDNVIILKSLDQTIHLLDSFSAKAQNGIAV